MPKKPMTNEPAMLMMIVPQGSWPLIGAVRVDSRNRASVPSAPPAMTIRQVANDMRYPFDDAGSVRTHLYRLLIAVGVISRLGGFGGTPSPSRRILQNRRRAASAKWSHPATALASDLDKPSPRLRGRQRWVRGSLRATIFLNEFSGGATPSPNPLPREDAGERAISHSSSLILAPMGFQPATF